MIVLEVVAVLGVLVLLVLAFKLGRWVERSLH
jgi:hypothetical protein